MVPRRIAWFCLMALLLGCDDPQISSVTRRLMVMAEGAPPVTADTVMVVEIHGLPWDGATPDEIARTMKMPEGPARTARFVPVAPGDSLIGGAERLVLRFNPPGELDSPTICQAKGPLPTEPPDGDGFTLDAVYCRESEWLIQAHMDSSAAQDDWLAYYLAMEKLLGKMFEVE